jgi:glutathione S-transferase
MPLKIWGRLSSINVKKVVWAAQELGLPFERTEAGGAYGVVKTPGYLAMNPNALVPVMDDDGFVLWESNVIVRYLCAKYAPTLATSCAALPPEGAVPSLGRPGASAVPASFYPVDLQERFQAERWMDWQQTSANPAGREAFIQWVRTAPAQRNQQAIDKSVASMSPKLALLDAHFATRAFAVGETFTMADIPLGCEIQRWWGLPHSETPRLVYPNIDRWYTCVLARPASRGVLDLPLL